MYTFCRVKQVLEEIEATSKKNKGSSKPRECPSYCRRINVELKEQCRATTSQSSSLSRLSEKNVELRLSQGHPQNQAFFSGKISIHEEGVQEEHQTILQYLSGNKKVQYGKDSEDDKSNTIVPSEKLWNKIKV